MHENFFATFILLKCRQRATSSCDVATWRVFDLFGGAFRVTEVDVNPGERSLHQVDNLITGRNIMKHNDGMYHMQQYKISTHYIYNFCNISEHLTANHKHADFAPKLAVGNVLTLLTPATSGLPSSKMLVLPTQAPVS